MHVWGGGDTLATLSRGWADAWKCCSGVGCSVGGDVGGGGITHRESAPPLITPSLTHPHSGLLEEAELMHVAAHLINAPSTGRNFLVMLCAFLANHKLHLLSNINTKVWRAKGGL